MRFTPCKRNNTIPKNDGEDKAVILDRKVLEVIKILNEKIKDSFNDFKGVYLYGSKTKGIITPDNDIDIVAIFENVNRDKRMDIWGIVGKIEAEFDVFIDLHPMTTEDLQKNPIYYDQVVNNGIYYEAA